MSRLFIPTDRVGLVSLQESISATVTAINDLLKRQVEVGWHTNRLFLESTPLWPEGHWYQCGYSVEDHAANREVLDRYQLRYEALASLPPADYQPRPVKIALYDGRGADREFSNPLTEVLEMGGFGYDYVDDGQIRGGRLGEYDILIVPGSPDAGECYYAGLGDLGLERIRQFIAGRGHYLGVCGGAYLPLTSYNKLNHCWLNAVSATEEQDLDYWRTGSGFVRCRIDDNEHPVFCGMVAGVTNSINIVYWEGPAIKLMGAGVKQLAHFESLLCSGAGPLRPYWDMQDNAPAIDAVSNWYNPLTQQTFDRLMRNRCAIGEGEYEGHKILMFSPHPEMGNIGYGPRKDSLNFLLIYNSLFYLSAQ